MRPAVHGHLDLKSLKRTNDVLGIDHPPAYETPEHNYQQNALLVQEEEEEVLEEQRPFQQQEDEVDEQLGEVEQYTRKQVMRMNAQQLKDIFNKNSWKNYKNTQQARKTILAFYKQG